MDVLTQPIRNKIERLFEKDYHLTFYERFRYLLDSEKTFEHLPYPHRYAKTLDYILSRISVPIKPREPIVGSVAEIIPTAEQISLVNNTTDQWWNLPDQEIQQKILWFYSDNWLRRRPPWFYSFGHLGLEWARILEIGLDGYKAAARQRLDQVRNDRTRRQFVEGAIACYDALSEFIMRYSHAADALAQTCGDQGSCQSYTVAAEICAHISRGPARSLHEALQLLWLVIMPLMKVCGCGVLDLGRMDQYLLPYYRRDLDNGDLTQDEARKLLVEFFYKNNEIMSPADHMSIEDIKTDFTLEMTFDDPNYLILGGRLPDGSPGVNELSYLCIEAQAALGLKNPFVVVRYYDGIEERFWNKTCEAMRDNTTIVVYNDETMIPALTSYGIPLADAADYGFYGCNDPDITGKQGGLRQLWFNLLLPLQLVLDRNRQRPADVPRPGESQFTLRERMIGLLTEQHHGIQTKLLAEIGNMDELLGEYRKQVRFLLADFRAAFDRDVELEREYNQGRIRIEDCFLDGPMERALTWNDGGSRYNVVTLQGSGVASAADSLATIQELVFQDEEIGLEGLAEILRADYQGHDDFRRRIRHRLPKFGNDISWVDELARQVTDIFCDEVARQNDGDHLYVFLPTLSTDRDFTSMGRIVGATPDGRRAKDPISENQSPTEGADSGGLTALLNSVSRIPFHRITGGPLNIRLHPTAVGGTEGLQAMAAALRTYLENGGMQVQINVVGKDQLLDAQTNPDRYRGLCVRVTGYSAYFVQMGQKAQEELIQRTEHGVR